MQIIMRQIFHPIWLKKWVILFWGFFSLVSFFLLIELPPKPQSIEYLDKLQHAFIFIVLTVFATMAWKPYKYRLAAALILYGATTELLQAMFTVTRQASADDWLADIAGIIIGLSVFAFLQISANKKSL